MVRQWLLEVNLWAADQGDDAISAVYITENLRKGMYVRVFGSLKIFNGKRNMIAFKLLPAKFEQVALHMAEVLQAHLYNTRGPLTSFHNTQFVAAPQQTTTTTTSATGGLDVVVALVKTTLDQHDQPLGLSIEEICKLVRRPLEDVAQALDLLASEAMVFQPEEGRFKVTSGP